VGSWRPPEPPLEAAVGLAGHGISRPPRLAGVCPGHARGRSASSSAARSCRRELIPSLVNTLRRCHSTVGALRNSCAPPTGRAGRESRSRPHREPARPDRRAGRSGSGPGRRCRARRGPLRGPRTGAAQGVHPTGPASPGPTGLTSRPGGAPPGRDWPVVLATGGCERRPAPTTLGGPPAPCRHSNCNQGSGPPTDGHRSSLHP
jgi:hypothetical protein